MKTKLDIYDENVSRLSDVISELTPEPPRDIEGARLFKAEGGKALAWVLSKSPPATIAKWILEPDTNFTSHQHKGNEIIVLCEGAAVYKSSTIEKHMKPGDCVSVPPGKDHSVVAGPEGAWFSVTTIPKEEGLEDG